MIFTQVSSWPVVIISEHLLRSKMMKFCSFPLTSNVITGKTVLNFILEKWKGIPVVVLQWQEYSSWIRTLEAYRTLIYNCLFSIPHNITKRLALNIASFTEHSVLQTKSPSNSWDKHESNGLIYFIINACLSQAKELYHAK